MPKSMKSLNIAIDYDHTWSADPVAFKAIYFLLASAGHNPMIVTGRHEDDEAIVPEHRPPGLIWYTGRAPKREFMAKAGIQIDIWIDDAPESIVDAQTIAIYQGRVDAIPRAGGPPAQGPFQTSG